MASSKVRVVAVSTIAFLMVAACSSTNSVEVASTAREERAVTGEEALLFSHQSLIPCTLLLQLTTTGEFHLPHASRSTEHELRDRSLVLAREAGDVQALRALEKGDFKGPYFNLAWLHESLEARAAFDAKYLPESVRARTPGDSIEQSQQTENSAMLRGARSKIVAALCQNLDVRTVIGAVRSRPGVLVEVWNGSVLVDEVRVADLVATIDMAQFADELREAEMWTEVLRAAEHGLTQSTLAQSSEVAPLTYDVFEALISGAPRVPESARLPEVQRFASLPIWDAYARSFYAFRSADLSRSGLGGIAEPTEADEGMGLLRSACRLLCIQRPSSPASPIYVPGFARENLVGNWTSTCASTSVTDSNARLFVHHAWVDQFLGTTWVRRLAGEYPGLDEWLGAGRCGDTYGPVVVGGESLVLEIVEEIRYQDALPAGTEHWVALHSEMETFERYCTAAYLHER